MCALAFSSVAASRPAIPSRASEAQRPPDFPEEAPGRTQVEPLQNAGPGPPCRELFGASPESQRLVAAGPRAPGRPLALRLQRHAEAGRRGKAAKRRVVGMRLLDCFVVALR